MSWKRCPELFQNSDALERLTSRPQGRLGTAAPTSAAHRLGAWARVRADPPASSRSRTTLERLG